MFSNCKFNTLAANLFAMTLLKDATVLIVDDYEINIQVLKLILARFGMKLEIATNGVVAVEKYKKNHHNIVLMDLMMPEMDGYEATKIIRLFEEENQLSKALVIAVSANYSQSENSEYLKSGFDDMMAKPFVYSDLQRIFSKYFQF